jgi:hypothetical protein
LLLLFLLLLLWLLLWLWLLPEISGSHVPFLRMQRRTEYVFALIQLLYFHFEKWVCSSNSKGLRGQFLQHELSPRGEVFPKR